MKKRDRELAVLIGVIVVGAMIWWLFQQWWFWLIVGLLVGLALLLKFGLPRFR